MRSRSIAILLLAAITAGCRAQELTIVAQGRRDYQIVLGEGPDQVARMAADELQRWLAEATGVTLPIAAEADPTLKQIFIGQAALPADAGVDIAALPPEGFVVRTVGDDLVLVGMDDGIHPEEIASTAKPTRTGTMNAVYDFLED